MVNPFPLRSGTREGCSLFTAIQYILEVLANTVKKERKGIDQKGRNKTVPKKADDMIIYIESSP